jgi:hypothetical protein
VLGCSLLMETDGDGWSEKLGLPGVGAPVWQPKMAAMPVVDAWASVMSCLPGTFDKLLANP